MTMLTQPQDADHMLHVLHEVGASSSHDEHRIGSVLKLADGTLVSSPNLSLQEIVPEIKNDVRVGSASSSKHSEQSVIAKAAQQGLSTQDAEIWVTDPLCPNCMNAVVASGVKEVIIPAEAFEGESEWYSRRARHFDATSLQIAANAGVKVFKIRKSGVLQRPDFEEIPLPSPSQNIKFEPYNEDTGQGSFTVERVPISVFNPQDYEQSLRKDFNERSGKQKAFNQANPTGWAALIIPPLRERIAIQLSSIGFVFG